MDKDKTFKTTPNLIIAGAPKCGTSSLFFWLGAHPEVCPSKVKETYFLADSVNHFNQKANIHDHGLAAYGKFFNSVKDEKWLLEATPVYIYQNTPLQIISKLPNSVKVIFILRKPADRLYSHWKFNRYRMKNTHMTFKEYLDYRNAPREWSNYIEQTRYVSYLKRWFDLLGPDRLLVYQFEALKMNQKAFMRSVAEDLNIDSRFYESFDFFHRNQTVAITSKRLHRIGLKLEPTIPSWIQELVIPIYLKLNSRKAPTISKAEIQLKSIISEQFEADNRKLKELFPSIDLNLW